MKPRCLVPVRGDETRPCWRPRDHRGRKHMPREAWLRKLALNRGYRGPSRRKLRPHGTEAAYRRELRAREVPCEACRRAANDASAKYRKTWLAKMTVPGGRDKA